MKVLHLITTLDRGGAEIQLVQQVEYQNDQGLDVEVRYLKGEGCLARKIAGVSVGRIPGKFFIQQIFSLIFIIRRKKFDILVAHLPRSEFAAAIATRYSDCNLIVTKHNTEKFWPRGNSVLSNHLARFVAKSAYKTICITKAVEDYLISINELVDGESTVIHYGMKREDEESPKYWENQILGNQLKIICIARLEPQKNLFKLLELAPRIVDLNPNMRIFGRGSQKDLLDSEIKSRGLTDIITLCGLTDNVRKELKKSNVLILPSLYEGFGLVLLEALDAGCLVIASRTPAIVEVMGENYPLLFDPNSLDEIEARVRQAIRVRDTVLVEYRDKLLTKYSLEEQFKKTISVFRDCLKTKRVSQ